MNILKSLYWRYSVKHMNGEKIPFNKLNTVLEGIRLCPTSLGMQPFKVIVIENQNIKKKIFPIAYKQQQIINCSHLIVFAFWDNHYEDQVYKYIKNIQHIRNLLDKELEEFKKTILNFLKSKTIEEIKNWAKNQTYIALGMAITICAIEKIDSTPIEGFIPKELDKLLSLKEQNLCSSVLLALGVRNEKTDYLLNQQKVRRSAKDFFIYI